MSKTKRDVVWTVKVDPSIDKATQRISELFGYHSKADVVREAVREFLIRRGLANLLGGEPAILETSPESPREALAQMKEMLKDVPAAELREIVARARDEVARELLGQE